MTLRANPVHPFRFLHAHSFGLLRHMGTQGFHVCTSFWKSRPACVTPTVASSSIGDCSNCATYFSTCSRRRGFCSAASRSGFPICVNPPHSGHFTTSSLIMTTHLVGSRGTAPLRAACHVVLLKNENALRAVTKVVADCDRSHRFGLIAGYFAVSAMLCVDGQTDSESGRPPTVRFGRQGHRGCE